MNSIKLEQGTPEWIEWRKKGIGASECAAILGICPYSTPYKVWSEKIGLSKGFAGNFATQRGTELESKARSLYELINLETMNPAIAVHPKYDYLRASLDGISDDGKTILEIKVPSKETHEGAKNGIVPPHYRAQIQMQLLVTGADTCHFFTFSEKDESHGLVEVKPDLAMQADILVRLSDFWNNNVLKNTPPPLTDQDHLYVTEGPIVDLFKELFLINKDDKVNRNEVSDKIVILAGHSKVKTNLGQLTSVKRNGVHSFYKITGAACNA